MWYKNETQVENEASYALQGSFPVHTGPLNSHVMYKEPLIPVLFIFLCLFTEQTEFAAHLVIGNEARVKLICLWLI